MSDEDYKRGVQRGLDGASSAHGLDGFIFDTEKAENDREEGYRAGIAASANAEAIERSRSRDSYEPDSYSGGGGGGPMGFETIPTAIFAGLAVWLGVWLIFGIVIGLLIEATAEPGISRAMAASFSWSSTIGKVLGIFTCVAILYGTFKDKGNRRELGDDIKAGLTIIAVIIGVVFLLKMLGGFLGKFV